MSARPAATVVIPTHDHGPLVELAARSVLTQTASDLELFIVGDGVPEVTRRIADRLCAEDRRVRFFDNPKGPRHGEVHRHAALEHARGDAIIYHADDDLWFPDHVEHMLGALRTVDFATAPGMRASPSGDLSRPRFRDFSSPLTRASLLAGRKGFGISFVGHTAAAYRTLPFGWRTTPSGIATDLYMWQQFFADPMLSAATTRRPTVLSFPSPVRDHMTGDERLIEMRRWWALVNDPVSRGELYARACDASVAYENRQRHKREVAHLRSPRRRLRAATARLTKRGSPDV